MVATQKWIAGSGQGLTWGNAITGASLNSLASGSAILSDVAITNGTALDVYADVSINLASVAFTGAGCNVAVSLYPLNADASTYGDGRFASAAAGPASYVVGTIPLVALSQAQEGTLLGIVLPPGTFKFVFCNNGGVALNATGNTAQYRTYNFSVG